MTQRAGHLPDLGETALGIELGSTSIKACLIGPDHATARTGSPRVGERARRRPVDLLARRGVGRPAGRVAALVADVERRYGVRPTTFGALGVSAMMHGYLPFDADGELLVPFRTWRNTNTGPAAAELSELFGHNIPLRWSIAHLYQAILDDEPHVPRDRARSPRSPGYVHRRADRRHVLGVGDASGMFPIDPATGDYDARMLEQFGTWPPPSGPACSSRACCPQVLTGGRGRRPAHPGGRRAARPDRHAAGPACRCARPRATPARAWSRPTRSRPRTGNISAGTSIFAMVVLEQPLEPACTTSSTWSPPRPATSSRWCTATTAPASSTRGPGSSAEFAAALGQPAEPDAVFGALLARRARRRRRRRRPARVQLPRRRAHHRPRRGPPAVGAHPRTAASTLAELRAHPALRRVRHARASACACCTPRASRSTRCSRTAGCSAPRAWPSGCWPRAIGAPVAVGADRGRGRGLGHRRAGRVRPRPPRPDAADLQPGRLPGRARSSPTPPRRRRAGRRRRGRVRRLPASGTAPAWPSSAPPAPRSDAPPTRAARTSR